MGSWEREQEKELAKEEVREKIYFCDRFNNDIRIYILL